MSVKLSDSFIDAYIDAKKLIRDNEDVEYPAFLVAALMAADKDGIDYSAVVENFSQLRRAKNLKELGVYDD